MARSGPRKVWLKLHQYLALTVGFLFALIGLTGSHNAFYKEIDELLNPELVIKSPRGAYRSLDEIMQAVNTVHPTTRKGSWFLMMPHHHFGMLAAAYTKPEEKAGEFNALLWVDVNPYTAEVVRSYFWGETLVSWIYDLHNTLLMGETGHKIAGFLGLVLMVSLGTGLYLWWPRGGKLAQAFVIKRGTSFHQVTFDVHRVSGIYSVMVLFILAFSGLCMVYPDYIRPLVDVVSPVRQKPVGFQSALIPGAKPISLTQAVAIADQVFPNGELRQVITPEGPTGIYLIRKRQPEEIERHNPESMVWIDQYSGKVLGKHEPRDNTMGEAFLSIQWSLHSGRALGLPGRILNCLMGFMPLILYITGIIQWLKKPV